MYFIFQVKNKVALEDNYGLELCSKSDFSNGKFFKTLKKCSRLGGLCPSLAGNEGSCSTLSANRPALPTVVNHESESHRRRAVDPLCSTLSATPD